MTRIVISGFTAAGKTTHARLLAQNLDLPYFSATDALSRVVTARTGEETGDRWSPAIDRARNRDGGIDDFVDQELRALLEEQPTGVFDASMLPWVAANSDAIALWIDSGLASRVRKCFVSHLDEDLDMEEVRQRVLAKDTMTVDRLLASHGAAFWPSAETFDIIVSNGDLIPQATLECAEEGIAAFQETITQAIAYHVGDLAHRPDDPRILHVTDRLGGRP